MHLKRISGAALLLAASLAAASVEAKVIDQSDIGFTVAHTAQVAASPDDVWKMLRLPDKWWSKEHSWSGDAANFWLDSQAGGCFCEKLPPAKPGGVPGSVQHARILFAKPDELMRLASSSSGSPRRWAVRCRSRRTGRRARARRRPRRTNRISTPRSRTSSRTHRKRRPRAIRRPACRAASRAPRRAPPAPR